jgi:hypothetical protein
MMAKWFDYEVRQIRENWRIDRNGPPVVGARTTAPAIFTANL